MKKIEHCQVIGPRAGGGGSLYMTQKIEDRTRNWSIWENQNQIKFLDVEVLSQIIIGMTKNNYERVNKVTWCLTCTERVSGPELSQATGNTQVL